MSETPPEVSVKPVRKAFLSGASVVWLIPLLALVVALGVAWRSYNERGPEIQIEFESGAGIAAGQTELKYRNITVGRVESVGFTEGLGKVVATVRVDKSVAPFIDSSAVFWIVEPEVTLQGVSGLSTVLSGVYIEGSWDEEAGQPQYRFQGAGGAPLIRPGQSGLQIAFRSTATGQLTDNAPILFKGIEVGRVGRAKIAPGGTFAIAEALIFEEHRDLINQSTRFWDTSGFSVSIGTAGAEIDFSSLATLLGGGITFDTFVSGGDRVQDGMIFDIYATKESARNSVFNASEVEPLELAIIFDDNVSGLAVGAPVELSGLNIGRVETLAGIVDYNQFGDSRVRLNATISIQPARLGLPGEVTADSALNFLEERVSNGLRARLASASLLTGGLKVELVDVDNPEPARLAALPNELPILPTTESETSDAAATVEGVFTRINNLPIEELLNSAIGFLNSADRLISDENLRETPQDVRTLLGDLSGLVNSEEVQNVPVALNAALSRVEQLVVQLEEERLAQRVVAAIDAATVAAETVGASVEGVPQLIESLHGVAAKAEALSVEELLAAVTNLVGSLDTIISSEAAVALPASLQDAIREVTGTLTDLREGGAVDNINSTLVAARQAADNVVASTQALPDITARLNEVLDSAAEAAGSVESSIEGVPALIARIESVAAKAEALQVEDLLAEVTDLLRSADAVIASEAAVALPASLKDAIDQINATLQELRDGGAIRDINQTLASARTAAGNIANSTAELPELTAQLRSVLTTAAEAAGSVNSSIEGVPALIARIEDVAAKADALQIEELLAEVTSLIRSADSVVGSEAAVALPESLRQAIDQINGALQELRDGGAVRDINQTLASARTAAANIANTSANLPEITARLNAVLDEAAAAAGSVNSSVEGVPDLIAQLQAVAAKAESLAVEELLTEVTELTRSFDAVVGTEDAVALPGALASALDEVNLTLQELREGGAVENVNRTLDSARTAADSIAASAGSLPQIVDRLTQLFAQASQTIAGYDQGADLSRSARETLRDIQKAADALASLARTIERNPNSLLLGR